jgi:hypothetical protein
MGKSRHANFLCATVARDFICAEAEGIRLAVAVTYREFLIATTNAFGNSILRRIPLSDIHSIDVSRGKDVNYLLLHLSRPEKPVVMVMYRRDAIADIERLLVAIGLLSRRRSRPALLLRARDIDREVALSRSRREETRGTEAHPSARRVNTR